MSMHITEYFYPIPFAIEIRAFWKYTKKIIKISLKVIKIYHPNNTPKGV